MKSKMSSSKKVKKSPSIKSLPNAMSPSKDMSVNVRQIENGFIVRKSGNDKDGKWFEREVFSEKNPLEGM